jgi:hypothetical protein
VRPIDLWVAVIAPPLAFLVATLTAGQISPTSGTSLTGRAATVFVTLGLNAPWIIGATMLALVIVLVRRARAKKAGIL